MYVCTLCRHAGKIVGYVSYRRFGRSTALLYCERLKKPVRQDDVCIDWEDQHGKKIEGARPQK